MEDKHISTLVKTLLEKIEKLESDNWWLEYENKKLIEEIELYKKPRTNEKEI